MLAGNCSSKEREKIKHSKKMWVWVESERERDQTKKKKKYFVNSLANLECDKRKIKHKWTKEREEREENVNVK